MQTEGEPHSRFVPNRWARAALLAGLTLLMYWLCLRFVFPHYFAPLAPFHQDFYDYVGVVRNRWGQVMMYPRPVTFLLFKLIGYWDVPFSMAVGIGVALGNVVLTLLYAERIWPERRQATWAGIVLYLAVLFSHPQFYFEHRHDMPAFFSLLFLMLTLHAWLAWLQKGRAWTLAACLLCIIGFSFTKEAFFVSIAFLALPLFFLYPAKRVQTALFLTVCLAAEISEFLLSKSRSSPFVNPGSDTAGPYFINTHLGSIEHVLSTYLRKAFIWPGAALAVIALLALAVRPRAALVGFSFVAAGIAALLPLSVLPNHIFSEYAWMAAPFAFLPVAFLPFEKWRSAAVWALTAAALLLLVRYEAIAKKVERDRDITWYLEQETVGRNLFDSLRGIGPRLDSARRVLVTGITTPFLPWGVDAYTEWRFGNQRYWFILTPDDESGRGSRLVQFERPSEADISKADAVMVYDAAGHLSRIVRKREQMALIPGLSNAPVKPEQPAVQPVLHLEPAIAVADKSGNGLVKLAWTAPAGMVLQIRVGAPDGALMGGGTGSGSASTGPWVKDGMTFYLQDVSGGKDLSAANTVAQATAHLIAAAGRRQR